MQLNLGLTVGQPIFRVRCYVNIKVYRLYVLPSLNKKLDALTKRKRAIHAEMDLLIHAINAVAKIQTYKLSILLLRPTVCKSAALEKIKL